MKRLLGVLSALILIASLATPAQSAEVKYSVYQKTLATYSGSITALSSVQKAQIRATIEKTPDAEKFICTGIRYFDQPMSVNIMVRKRAKAACEYAKQLNPKLSTWYQNKPTKARSYAGKVLLTVKTPLIDEVEEPAVDDDSNQDDGSNESAPPPSQDETKEEENDSPDEISVSKAAYRYPACDTAANQPLTEKYRSTGFSLARSYDCATDRTLPSPALPAVVSSNSLEPCMIVDQSREGTSPNGYKVGFPRSTYKWPDGRKKVVLVAFDFPDIKDPVDPVELLSEDVAMFKEYMDVFTRGKVSFDFYIHPERIALLEPSSKFSQSEAQANTGQFGDANVSAIDYFYTEAIRAMDPVIDFTDHDMVLFIPPRHQEVFAEFNLWPPLNNTYPTNEDPIVRGFTPGGGFHFREDNDLWFFWAHESLHYFRLPDLYWHDQNSVKRTENTFSGAFKNFDIMDGAFTRTLNSYLMWIADWTLAGEQVCLTSSSFQDSSYELFPVSNKDETLKSVMIRLSDSELLVVESRRNSKFDRIGNRANEGVIVYVVNSTIGNGEGAITVIAPEGRTFIWDKLPGGNNTERLDAFLYEGNQIEIAGYKIEVNKAYEISDVVSISKVSNWVSGSEPNYVCVTRENRQLDNSDRSDCPLRF